MKSLIKAIRNRMSENQKKHQDLTGRALYEQALEKKWTEKKEEFPQNIRDFLIASTGDENCRIIIRNDEVTPMEYVVFVLEKFFGIESEKAAKLMLECHSNGSVLVAEDVSASSAEKILLYLRGHADSRGYPFIIEVELS